MKRHDHTTFYLIALALAIIVIPLAAICWPVSPDQQPVATATVTVSVTVVAVGTATPIVTREVTPIPTATTFLIVPTIAPSATAMPLPTAAAEPTQTSEPTPVPATPTAIFKPAPAPYQVPRR